MNSSYGRWREKIFIYWSEYIFYCGGSASRDGPFKSVTTEDILTVKLYSVLSLFAFGFKMTMKTKFCLVYFFDDNSSQSTKGFLTNTEDTFRKLSQILYNTRLC